MSNQAPYGHYPGTRIPRKSPARDEYEGRGACKRCGTPGLVWEMHERDRWVLVDMGGKRHVCPKGARC
jgi:hypothetical protein